MSTIAMLGMMMPDGKIQAVCLHEHGYTEYAGAVLYRYYNSPEKAVQLFKYGFWKTIDQYLPDTHRKAKVCVPLPDTSVIVYDSKEEFCMRGEDKFHADFHYLYCGDHWEARSPLFDNIWGSLDDIFSEATDFAPRKFVVDLSPKEWISFCHKSKLKKDPHFLFWRISHTQLSIARYYGGCTYNKYHYVYFQSFDALFREDFLKEVKHTIKGKGR